MITLATAYPVTIQLASSRVAPRLPMILGRATLTIVVSINSSSAARITVMVMIHLLKPCSAITNKLIVNYQNYLFRMNGHVHAHARTQPPQNRRICVYPNPERYTLNDFYEVSCSVI